MPTDYESGFDFFSLGSVKGNPLGVGQGQGETSWTAGKIGLLYEI